MRKSILGLGLVIVIACVAALSGCASQTTIPDVDDTTPVVVYFWPSPASAGTKVTGVVSLGVPAAVDVAVTVQAVYNGGIVGGLPTTVVIPAGGLLAEFPVTTNREMKGNVVVQATTAGGSDYTILVIN